jgi:hypothetical protein
LARERPDQVRLGDGARLDEEPAQRFAATRLLGESRVELSLRQETLVDQQRAQGRSVGQDSLLARLSTVVWSLLVAKRREEAQ